MYVYACCPLFVTGSFLVWKYFTAYFKPSIWLQLKLPSYFPCSLGPEWYLVRVELTVTDVNDNIPEWSMVPAPYLAVVSPDASAGSLVYKLFAEDGDEGNNGEVEYFLSDGRLNCFFFFCLHSVLKIRLTVYSVTTITKQGGNNVTEELWKWQANSKQLIANIQLHYYMNLVFLCTFAVFIFGGFLKVQCIWPRKATIADSYEGFP